MKNVILYKVLFFISFYFFSYQEGRGLSLNASHCASARLKDIASIRGVRQNQLIGYGIVVGLKGTGDGKSEFTAKSLGRMLDKLGIKLESQKVESKNAAAVIVTAQLPAFAKSGNPLDVTVSALGDASSLEGGVLLQTPLRAANEEIFAVAQGSISLGGGRGGQDVFPQWVVFPTELLSKEIFPQISLREKCFDSLCIIQIS
jgi:flagellar basal body P-ring protein FlgI